jgi:cobalt-precorrin-5B (C1)-methyltransferase
MAQGIPHTHAAKSTMPLKSLAQWVMESCHQSKLAAEVENANTARQAFDMIRLNCPGVIERVGYEIINAARQFAGKQIELQSVILDFEGRIVFDSDAGRRVGGLI